MRRTSSISSMSSASSEPEETMQIFVKTVSGSQSKYSAAVPKLGTSCIVRRIVW